MSSATFSDARWLCLPAVPSSSARCRALLRSTLEEWGLPDCLDDALLLSSELCSNVVLHAHTAMVVGVSWDRVGRTLRVSVQDGSRGMPTVRPQSDLAPSGRGLRLVETIASRWGSQPLPAGKVVWFELRTGARSLAREM